MKTVSRRRVGIAAGLGLAISSAAIGGQHPASFAEFDRRAQAGETLSVVFFGGSLTYGANASDPLKTSYRGLMGQYLKDRYPKAHIEIHDAAIGGTGSQLGLFRLERDVLSCKPDLVFLDFTVNDGYDGKDVESLCFYETILRRMVSEGIAVQQMYFAFKWQFGDGYKLAEVYRRTDHMKLSAAYHTAQGDLYPLMQEIITSGKLTPDQIWPFDGAHPDDAGYAIFFEAARLGFEKAVKDALVCVVPEKPVFGLMKNAKRFRLADGPLPKGWSRAKTLRTSLWFDGLSSRWMGDVAMCDAKDAGKIEPLRLEFEGTYLGFFGEGTHESLSAEIRVDGKVVPYEIKRKTGVDKLPVWTFKLTFGQQGNLFVWRRTPTMLPPGKHVLEIIPLVQEGDKGQLRIESVCVADLNLQ